VLWIHTQAQVQFDSLVELGELDLLNQRDRIVQIIGPMFYLFGRSEKLLTLFWHVSSLVQTAEAHLKRPLPPTEF
jgi:hypothetical protein